MSGERAAVAYHVKHYKAWQNTKMVKTFENLKPGVKTVKKIKAKGDANFYV
ncbi:MAG: hypothetical protein AAB089_01870 [Nitrospirota bacterium]